MADNGTLEQWKFSQTSVKDVLTYGYKCTMRNDFRVIFINGTNGKRVLLMTIKKIIA